MTDTSASATVSPPAAQPHLFSAGLVLPVVMLGTFLSVLDSTILNVALPYVMASFSSDVDHAKWITAGLFLGATVSMPLSGWLSQRFGNGAVYIAALAVFTGGAVFSSMAWTLNVLIAARVIQGLAAGLIQPTSVAILTQAYPPNMRGRVFGIWSIGQMTAPSLGPAAGGVIIETIDWRAIFVLSAGVGVLALLMAMAVLDRKHDKEVRQFDWPGYIALSFLLVVGFLIVTYGDREGWHSTLIVSGILACAAAFGVLLLVEWNEPYAIMPLRLFKRADFSLAAFITVYRALGMMAPGFLLPIFMFNVQGRASMDVGFMLMPGAMVMASVSPVAGYLTDRFGARWPTVFGAVLMGASLYSFHTLDESTTFWQAARPLIIQGIGVAFVMTPIITVGMNAVGRQDLGSASWIINVCHRGGGAFAITILGALLARENVVLGHYLGTAPILQSTATGILAEQARDLGFPNASAGQAALAGALHNVGAVSSTVAFEHMFLIAALTSATIVLPALLLGGRHLPEAHSR